MEMKAQGWNVRTCEPGGEDASLIRELTMNSKYVLYMNDISVALLREDGNELGAVMCGGLNVGPNGVARAVKASLVDYCNLRDGDSFDCKVKCARTCKDCDPTSKGPAVDPFDCPLVLRVLDALGMGGKVGA